MEVVNQSQIFFKITLRLQLEITETTKVDISITVLSIKLNCEMTVHVV